MYNATLVGLSSAFFKAVIEITTSWGMNKTSDDPRNRKAVSDCWYAVKILDSDGYKTQQEN